uniref:BMP family ABC transporter substrate-binding protein n=1 Tax=Thermosphaera aggregans TaxID=54254 RepID=A0A7C2FD17_9CREN
MKSIARTTLILVVVALLVIAGVAVIMLGGFYQTGTQPTEEVKVLVLFDVGGRGDLSFNDMAWLGAERAKNELNVKVDYTTPRSVADMENVLRSYSESGEYDLIVLVGFLWTDPLNKTADNYPNQKYALIDASTFVNRNNEVDILFREQEVGALVGVLASGMAKSLNASKVGAVAGMSIPPLWRFHIGYLFGIKYFEMKSGYNVSLLWQYTNTFTDPQVGYNTAWQMLQQGAPVLYGLAGYTHVGMMDAVVDWNKNQMGKAFAIGQDASQEWYAPEYIPLSGAKRVDVAVYTAIKMVVEKKWEPGIKVLGLAEGGVGIWDLEGVRTFAEWAREVGKLGDYTVDEVVSIVNQTRTQYIDSTTWEIYNELYQKISSGEIAFKDPASIEEYDSIINALISGDLNAALSRGTI